MNCFYLLIFLLSTSSIIILVNGDNAVTRIVGGHECASDNEKFTYQVSLQVMGENWCGGSILNEYYVITAAHCVVDTQNQFDQYPLKIVAGVTDLNVKADPNFVYDVVKVYVPAEFDFKTSQTSGEHTVGDVALLKVNRPMNISSNSKLSTVELPSDRSYVGYDAIITGYGWNWVKVRYDPRTKSLKEGEGYSNGKLRFAKTKVIDNDVCQRSYRSLILPTHICAKVTQHKSWQPEGICSGDSGGPLVYDKNTLVGVVSTSPLGCDESHAAAVYTRVSSYLDFIQKAINDEDDPNIRTTTLRVARNKALS